MSMGLTLAWMTNSSFPGTISAIGEAGEITPPTVWTCIPFTIPASGAVTVVLDKTSRSAVSLSEASFKEV